MCHKAKVLNQTKNGFLVSCESCMVYHLTFGHFYLELTEMEFAYFGAFIDKIDVNHWHNTNCDNKIKRKIPIPTEQPNLFLMLNPTELNELKRLVFFKEQEPFQFISASDVDYDFIKN
ncbi:DUF6686 family protein [Formosa sp. 4Alg 33]|uniref:DUF6686 family protein n=1 Tax=Formosa sp. 4Alg 33 TaxID=3382189 RepID=UPI003D9C507B